MNHWTRPLLRHRFVALCAVAVVLAGASAAAATNRIQIFQTEELVPVSLVTTDLVGLPDLRAYGEFRAAEPDVQRAPDAAAAAKASSLELPVVETFPRGVSGEPEYQVLSEVTATFTFSAARAAAAAEVGGPLPTPPPGLDGSEIRLVAGPGVAQVWSQPSGVPSLVVGRAVAPTASSSGAPFETVRDYLLSLPGMPDELTTQLRGFNAEGSALPLPVPADRFTSSQTEVNGHPVTLLVSRDRTMAAAVWAEDGLVTAVAGALDPEEVLSIARDLR